MPCPAPAALVLATIALAGCGGGAARDRAAPRSARADPGLTARPATPPPPTTPAVTPGRYIRALDAYCAQTTRALRRLAGSQASRRDPAAPVAALARDLRSGVERLGRLTPPASLRGQHQLVIAQGREAADRLDTGAQLARAGDTDAATAALLDLQDLLPRLPASLSGAAPACV